MSKSPNPYLHDRRILLALTINTFLLIVCVIVALLPLTDANGTIIAEYRSNLGLDGYKVGSSLDMISFGVFAIIVYAVQLYSSIKLYEKQKSISLIALLLGTVLLVFTLIVCNALIELR